MTPNKPLLLKDFPPLTSLPPKMTPNKPLLLKDFLELDANSDSCDSFLSAPRRLQPTATVRGLIADDRRTRLSRTKSKSALTKISAVINAVRLFSSPASRRGEPRFLPRSISKKLSRSFWKKRPEVEVVAEERSLRVRVRDIVRMRSFHDADVAELRRRDLYLTAPVVSSSSSDSSENGDSESSGSEFLLSCGSSEFCGEHDVAAAGDHDRVEDAKDSLAAIVGGGESYRETVTSRRDTEEELNQETEFHSEEEKEQLSPVSVMDFPDEYEEGGNDHDNEEEDNTDGFRKTLEKIERTRHQLLQNLRRFESLAQLDLEPVDLDASFAASDDGQLESTVHVESDVDENPAWELLCQLKYEVSWETQGSGSTEKLLLSFFSEGLSSHRRRQTHSMTVEEELLKAAIEWMCGGQREEGLGMLQIKEIERNGDWTRFEEGVDEVAADMEATVMRWLLDELVLDLVTC